MGRLMYQNIDFMNPGKILLLGGNFAPEPTGIGKYNGEMMAWLADRGFECSVVTTYPYYPYWKVQEPYRAKSWFFSKERHLTTTGEITIYRCPHFVPPTPSGVKRMISDLTFFVSAFLRVLTLLFVRKYDYIITVVPPFQLGLLGIFIKFFRGGKLIYHIQDLQIDAARDLDMIKSKSLLKAMFGIERYILRKSDYLSSISEGMIVKIMKKYHKPVLFFPNWVDTSSVFPIAERNDLKALFGFPSDRKIVLYSGAIGEKQGLEQILETAENLNSEKVTFIIAGSGPYKEKLTALARVKGLTNVYFMPLQPKEKFNQFLNMADLHLVLQKTSANDLVMPSKLSSILAVGGLVIVTAPRKTSLYEMLTKHDMGILVEPENQLELSQAIRTAITHPFDHVRRNAALFAYSYLSIDRILPAFLSETSMAMNNPQMIEKIIVTPTNLGGSFVLKSADDLIEN